MIFFRIYLNCFFFPEWQQIWYGASVSEVRQPGTVWLGTLLYALVIQSLLCIPGKQHRDSMS